MKSEHVNLLAAAQQLKGLRPDGLYTPVDIGLALEAAHHEITRLRGAVAACSEIVGLIDEVIPRSSTGGTMGAVRRAALRGMGSGMEAGTAAGQHTGTIDE